MSSLSPESNRTADAERRKRLGQYYTGSGLGRLLAALAQADKEKTIIDPMVGSGDLQASCWKLVRSQNLWSGSRSMRSR
ncbi:N-6 DNA methylase [Acidithiobacillus ferrooxidans]|uniref:N-6 DNA methylase n=1 Tax=Acidithiobacillus ferrooxidans TaxID=920 RepID=UPI001D029861